LDLGLITDYAMGGFVFFNFYFGWPTLIYFYFLDMIFLLGQVRFCVRFEKTKLNGKSIIKGFPL
jgi:hypothetical protein